MGYFPFPLRVLLILINDNYEASLGIQHYLYFSIIFIEFRKSGEVFAKILKRVRFQRKLVADIFQNLLRYLVEFPNISTNVKLLVLTRTGLHWRSDREWGRCQSIGKIRKTMSKSENCSNSPRRIFT